MSDAERPPPGPRPLDWVLAAGLCVLSAVIAVFGVFFLPLYRGSVPVPVVVAGVVAALVWLPRAGFGLTRRMAGALAPAAAWLVVSIVLYLVTNRLFLDVPVAWRGWQFALLIGLGSLAAASSIGLLWGDQLSTARTGTGPASSTAGSAGAAPERGRHP